MDLTFVRVKRMRANEKLADGIPRKVSRMRETLWFTWRNTGVTDRIYFFPRRSDLSIAARRGCYPLQKLSPSVDSGISM